MKKSVLEEIGSLGIESLKIVGGIVLETTAWFVSEVLRGLGLETPSEFQQEYIEQENIEPTWNYIEAYKEKTEKPDSSKSAKGKIQKKQPVRQTKKSQRKSEYNRYFPEEEFRDHPFSKRHHYVNTSLYSSDGSV